MYNAFRENCVPEMEYKIWNLDTVYLLLTMIWTF